MAPSLPSATTKSSQPETLVCILGDVMQRKVAGIFALGLFASTNGQPAQAVDIVPEGSIKLEDVVLDVPDGWTVVQEAVDAGTVIAGFAQGDQTVNLYVKGGGGF